jgi:hypothetical protein
MPMEVMGVVRWLLFVGGIFWTLTLWGCGGSSLPSQTAKGGTLVITFHFPTSERLIPTATTEIVVTVNGEGLSKPLKGTATPTNPTVTFSDVPPGAKFVMAFSRTSSTAPLPATIGTAMATVTAGATTSVTIDMQATRPPSRLTVEPSAGGQVALINSDKGETLLLGNNGGLQWFGFLSPQGAVTFDNPLSLRDGASIGQSVSQMTSQGRATMRLVGVIGVGVPAGDFANCVVIELAFTTITTRRLILYLARQFGPVMLFEGAPLGFSGQPTELSSSLPSVLVSGQVGTTSFNFANPFNGLSAPAYDGQLSAYLATQSGNRYDFSALLLPDNPPNQPPL